MKTKNIFTINHNVTTLKKIFNVYLLLRDRDRARAWEGQREEETQNLKEAPGSELLAQSPTWVSKLQTQRDHDLSQSQMPNRLSHTGAPYYNFLNSFCISYNQLHLGGM